MSGKKKQLFRSWFCRIEHEIMLPFITVGILVVCAFCVISVYSGYTEKLRDRKEYARTTIRGMEADIYYLQGRLSEEEIRQKYKFYHDPAVRIVTADGEIIAGDRELPDRNLELLFADSGNSLGWRLEYWLDKKTFESAILEEQNYIIVGAVASLLIIVQVSVFLAWSLTKPIRSMSAACRKIDENKDGFREYSFRETARKDEIGQLARTFENLLKNLDNYTKMEYTSRMSSALAHEIKNPLAGIRSGIQVLGGRAVKENEKFLCDSMLHEIDRVTGLINDLFTLSVKKENHRHVFRADVLLREVSAIYDRECEQQKVIFETECETCEIFADENETRQMLYNLLTNSMRAVKRDGTGKIRLSLSSDGEATVFCVTDNGKGMNEEELKRAREPFYTKSINGVGLGLAIVNRLIEQNHGKMEMESAPGCGTTVRLIFESRDEHEKGTDR